MAKVVSTGLPALDKALMNGLPVGFTMLVAGTPGSGTELFAKQFATAPGQDEQVVYFATAERDEDIKSAMEDFNWKSDMKIVNIGNMYYESVLAKKLEVSRARQEGLSTKDLSKLRMKSKQERPEINFLTSLTYEVSKLRPPFRVVIDSLDFFLEYYQDDKGPHAARGRRRPYHDAHERLRHADAERGRGDRRLHRRAGANKGRRLVQAVPDRQESQKPPRKDRHLRIHDH